MPYLHLHCGLGFHAYFLFGQVKKSDVFPDLALFAICVYSVDKQGFYAFGLWSFYIINDILVGFSSDIDLHICGYYSQWNKTLSVLKWSLSYTDK